jgi:PAS domain S-box-containing protein
VSGEFIDQLGGLRSLLATVHDYVIVLDEDRVIRYVNRVEEDRRMDEVLGQPAEAFLSPDTRERSREALDAAFQRGETAHYDVNVPRPCGSDMWLRSRLFPMRRDARTVAVVIFASDITELKQAQAEARDLKRLLPVCSWCDRIRNDEGEWETVALYLKRESGTTVSHSLCPDCSETQMSELESAGS